MRIGLFILNNDLIKKQIIDFYGFLEESSLKDCEVIVFVKEVRERKSGQNRFFERFYRCLISGRIFKQIFVKLWGNIKHGRTERIFKKLPITHIHIDSINSKDTIGLLEKSKLDYGIFILYDQIVKEDVLKLINYPINIHNAHLPNFRGCQPMYWLLDAKKSFSCVTMHRMTDGIDEGDIIFEYPIKLDNKKDVPYNTNNSIKVISLLLLFGIRRLVLFDKNFGINQLESKETINYYSRPNVNS